MLLLSLLFACSADTGFAPKAPTPEAPVGDAVASFSTTEILITDIDPQYSKSGRVTLTSSGTGPLEVYEARLVENPERAFYMEGIDTQDGVVLAPGGALDFQVAVTLPGPVALDGTLRVRTSDPEASAVLIPVRARPVGWTEEGDSGGDSGGAP